MIMRQSVTAGKTPVGAEVQAKLVVGTLGDGTVFPKNAIFSGKVIESVARPRPNRDDGTVVIGSTRSDIKLDKLTNYSLCRGRIAATKWILFAHYGAQDTSSQLPAWGIC